MPRLPTPGGDNGNWGEILNEYLSQSLASDGSLKNNAVGAAQLQEHSVTANALAPGAITKSSVGLENVDNTSDLDKPISDATQAALDNKITRQGASTTYALARFADTTGSTLQESPIIADGSGNLRMGNSKRLYMKNTGGSDIGVLRIDNGDITSIMSGGGGIEFESSTSAQLVRVTDSGLVGIGTNPTSSLHIKDGSGANGTEINIQNSDAAKRPALYLTNNTGDRAGFFFYGSASSTFPNDLRIHMDNVGGDVHFTGIRGMQIGGTDEAITDAKLRVNGTVRADDPVNSNHLTTKNYTDSNFVKTSGNSTVSGSLTIAGIGNDKLIISTGGANGGLSLGADVNAATRTANTRKFGIISAPNFANDADIEIFSLDSPSSTVNALSFGGRVGSTRTSATQINFVTSLDTTTPGGNVRMRIDNNGRVGIGTESPDTKLTVTSDDFFIAAFKRTTTGGGAAVRVENGNSYQWDFGVGGNNDEFAIIERSSTGAPQRLTVQKLTGNVGVGTTTPTYKLDVSDTSSAIQARFGSTLAGPQGIQVYRSGGDNVRLQANYSGYGGGLASSGPLRFSVNNNTLDSPALLINASGNIGVGSNPTISDTLSVAGNVRANDPTQPYHLATKNYVDTASSLVTSVAGKTGAVTINQNDLVASNSPSATTFYRGDGQWIVPTNTTYTAITVAEGQAGVATSSRTVRADYLKQIAQYWAHVRPYTAVTTTYTVLATDYCVNCTSGTFTVTLPSAATVSGIEFLIKNSGTGTITVATTSSQTIDGATSYALTTQYKYVTVKSNGANWIVIGAN